jgi:hypothetical protein
MVAEAPDRRPVLRYVPGAEAGYEIEAALNAHVGQL